MGHFAIAALRIRNCLVVVVFSRIGNAKETTLWRFAPPPLLRGKPYAFFLNRQWLNLTIVNLQVSIQFFPVPIATARNTRSSITFSISD